MFLNNYDYGYSYKGYQLSPGQWRVLVIAAMLQLIVWWKLFKKAGEPGWKSIIPILNIWTAIKIANPNGLTLLWLIGLVIPGIGPIVAFLLQWKFASKFTNRFGLKLLYMILPFITGLIFAFGDEFKYRPNNLNTVYR